MAIHLQAFAAASLSVLAYGQLAYKLGWPWARISCIETCAFYNLDCVEGAFPTTLCQGQSVQASTPEYAAEWAEFEPYCIEGGLNVDKNQPCTSERASFWDKCVGVAYA